MAIKHSGVGAISALLTLAPTSWAAPPSMSAGALKLDGAKNSAVEKAVYRRCWWRHGERICRWVGYRSHGYYDADGYYGYGPYYDYGPSFGFSFGGGRHFHGGYHR